MNETKRSYLVKHGTLEVHIFTEHLAKRPDMVRVEGTLEEVKAKAKIMRDDWAAAKEDPIILAQPVGTPEESYRSSLGVDMSAHEPISVDMDDVIAAIEMLEPGNTAHFTANGLPRIEAIQEQLGAEIDAQTRSEAWTELNRRRAGQ